MGETLRNSPILRQLSTLQGINLLLRTTWSLSKIRLKSTMCHRLGERVAGEAAVCSQPKVQDTSRQQGVGVDRFEDCTKHDFTSDEYEICLDKQYHNPPIVTPLQEPFMKYVIPHKYVQKEAEIPWRFIFTLCKRTRGTTEKTLDTINCLLEKNGLIPYDHAHPEFDRLKMQGLTIQNIS